MNTQVACFWLVDNVCVFTTEMGIARLWLLVAGMLWVMCWSGRMANGQSML